MRRAAGRFCDEAARGLEPKDEPGAVVEPRGAVASLDCSQDGAHIVGLVGLEPGRRPDDAQASGDLGGLARSQLTVAHELRDRIPVKDQCGVPRQGREGTLEYALMSLLILAISVRRVVISLPSSKNCLFVAKAP